jgi:hypothetical protein
MSNVVILSIPLRDLEAQVTEAYGLECCADIWKCTIDEAQCNVLVVANIEDEDLEKLPIDFVMDPSEVDELIQ